MFNDKVVEDKKVVKKSALRFFVSEYFLRYGPWKLVQNIEKNKVNSGFSQKRHVWSGVTLRLSAIGSLIKPMHCWAYSNHTAYFFVSIRPILTALIVLEIHLRTRYTFSGPLKKTITKATKKRKKKEKVRQYWFWG